MKAVILPLHKDDKVQLRSGVDFREAKKAPEWMVKFLRDYWKAVK